jgi:hypothetical protein
LPHPGIKIGQRLEFAPRAEQFLALGLKHIAEQNISATQEFVRELSYAKDIQDMLRIQMEFMRSQLEAFGEQAKDLGEAYIKAASGQTRTPSQ